jgi:hypothetical protein
MNINDGPSRDVDVDTLCISAPAATSAAKATAYSAGSIRAAAITFDSIVSWIEVRRERVARTRSNEDSGHLGGPLS